jgi:hypothetical protein
VKLDASRIVGRSNGTLTNNRAWDDMPIETDGTPISTGEGLNHENGLGVSFADLITQTPWNFANFNFIDIWEWNGFNMPRLRNETTWREWPSHLLISGATISLFSFEFDMDNIFCDDEFFDNVYGMPPEDDDDLLPPAPKDCDPDDDPDILNKEEDELEPIPYNDKPNEEPDPELETDYEPIPHEEAYNFANDMSNLECLITGYYNEPKDVNEVLVAGYYE